MDSQCLQSMRHVLTHTHIGLNPTQKGEKCQGQSSEAVLIIKQPHIHLTSPTSTPKPHAALQARSTRLHATMEPPYFSENTHAQAPAPLLAASDPDRDDAQQQDADQDPPVHCSTCDRLTWRSDFSAAQLQRTAQRRRCIECVAGSPRRAVSTARVCAACKLPFGGSAISSGRRAAATNATANTNPNAPRCIRCTRHSIQSPLAPLLLSSDAYNSATVADTLHDIAVQHLALGQCQLAVQFCTDAMQVITSHARTDPDPAGSATRAARVLSVRAQARMTRREWRAALKDCLAATRASAEDHPAPSVKDLIRLAKCAAHYGDTYHYEQAYAAVVAAGLPGVAQEVARLSPDRAKWSKVEAHALALATAGSFGTCSKYIAGQFGGGEANKRLLRVLQLQAESQCAAVDESAQQEFAEEVLSYVGEDPRVFLVAAESCILQGEFDTAMAQLSLGVEHHRLRSWAETPSPRDRRSPEPEAEEVRVRAQGGTFADRSAGAEGIFRSTVDKASVPSALPCCNVNSLLLCRT